MRIVDLVAELEAGVTELERRGGIGWLKQFGVSFEALVAVGAIGTAVARPAGDGLPKPFSLKELAGAVKAVLEEPPAG